ncbi:mas-related G-protein coupled receptor member B5-like [Betta splendens]|uniref:Mas-related G-protein coupled receptor member B5-like n=1 Tax=Betta splendens TaxID=158456 RepID=A0A8M1HED5_BETSP|nr:mas-related G-protein coupled receptor member B5-like [Betta splendens]XP_055365043.1 mas-related G-protein coupled receptor member B5-like [Betta splendens]
MNLSNINDTLMDTDDKSIHEVDSKAEAVKFYRILWVSTLSIAIVGLVLTPVAICAVSSLVKKDNVAPIFVINLLVSDIIQLCAMILWLTEDVIDIGEIARVFGLVASVGFMVCIALERYLLIVWPLWYRTRRTVKMCLLLCAVVWTLPLFYFIFGIFIILYSNMFFNITGVLLLLPLPLLVFFLVGTFRALSASISVHAEEKRRIVGLLVLVLLIYTLLFLPRIISYLLHYRDYRLHVVAAILLELNPVADLFLYIFLRKGAVNQVWFCLCCCRKNRTNRQSSSGLNDVDAVTSL